jgi:AraC-like DNA-binding protein
MDHDTLSDVLRNVRLRGAVFFSVSGNSGWVAEAPPARQIAPLLLRGVEHVMEYHVVAAGTCWAAIPGGPSVQLRAGDVVMFPHGDAHVVSSAPGMRGRIDLDWFAQVAGERWPVQVTYDGLDVSRATPANDDADATIVCGFLGCDLQPFNPLIEALAANAAPSCRQRGRVDRAVREAGDLRIARSAAGGEAMLARMSEMMFVDAVRRYADALPDESAGWLAGLRDRFVGKALALLHGQPAHDWTIDDLGHRVGLSRSALHERFVQLLGVAPMQYLAQWRMQTAARLLLETRSTVAAIALDVGYDSEAAFARAFKRVVGKPPAAWRRQREGGAD